MAFSLFERGNVELAFSTVAVEVHTREGRIGKKRRGRAARARKYVSALTLFLSLVLKMAAGVSKMERSETTVSFHVCRLNPLIIGAICTSNLRVLM